MILQERGSSEKRENQTNTHPLSSIIPPGQERLAVAAAEGLTRAVVQADCVCTVPFRGVCVLV